MPGYVYLIWVEGTDKYKIGQSSNPANRLVRLQTGSPHRLHLLGSMECPDPRLTESRLHQRFAAFRCRGEHFAFPPLFVPEVLAEFHLSTAFINSKVENFAKAVAKKLIEEHEQEEERLIAITTKETFAYGLMIGALKILVSDILERRKPSRDALISVSIGIQMVIEQGRFQEAIDVASAFYPQLSNAQVISALELISADDPIVRESGLTALERTLVTQ
ncbi:MAG: GIY-YIG nuclease family protein [Cyanobacteria bacterium J06554_6]